MKHLFRAGVLVTVVVAFLFVGLRVIPIPAFLANYGFHPQKTTENAQQWANLPIQFVSSSICADCHQKEYQAWQQGGHQTVSCENCHGAARPHLEEGARPIVNTSKELCALCHTKLISRPKDFPQVDIEEMSGGAECVTCHYPHEPRVGMPPQVPHSLEGRTDCQLCHAPEKHEPWVIVPPQAPHPIKERTECLSCHGPQELRGATLPHVPRGLAGSTNCLLCHSAGGIKPLPSDHFGRTSATCLNCHRTD